jgi:hypothetical protein
MSLIGFHGSLGYTAMYYTIILAVWGILRYLRKQGVDGGYWGALVIAEILYILQAALGAFLWISGIGNLTGHGIHILYGVVSVLVLPSVFVYTHGDDRRRASLIYGLFFLFLIGIILRAITTAPH